MTKKRTQNRIVKRKANPMSMKQQVPRNSFSFDGTNLHATIFITSSTTASTIATDFQQIGTDSGFAPSRVFNAMVKQYREYRYRKVMVQWLPIIGPSNTDAGSRVHFGYIDNPEQMFGFQTSLAPLLDGASERVAFVKGLRNVMTFNAWERLTWNVPLTRRKPWFDVNTSESSYDVNVFSRAVQGMVVQAYESVSAAVALGLVKITFDIELRGLNPDAGAVV